MTPAGAWLQQSLLQLSFNSQPIVQFDAEDISNFVSYCESLPPQLACDFLIELVGEENCKDIIAEYVHRRTKTTLSETEGDVKDGFRVYVKPEVDVDLNYGNKKPSKVSKAKFTASEDNIPSVDTPSDLLSGGKVIGNRVKRGTKGISLADAAKGKVLISRGIPCTCQATRHKLINNCLSCGRIVCEQEGEGPCKFCGTLVLLQGSTYAGLEGSSFPVTEAEAEAQVRKDRIVQNGRVSAQRTVIDDQGDYFQVEQNSWLSEEEKARVLKQQEEVQLKKEEQKKKMVVTIDLTDRKVVMVDDGADVLDIKTSAKVDDTSLGISTRRPCDIRIKPNPSVLENPVFLDLKQSKRSSSGNVNISSRRGYHGNRDPHEWTNTGRVQHDDPLISVDFTPIQHDNSNEISQSPNLRNGGSALLEDEECLMDCKASNASVTAFDICESGVRESHSLSPSILVLKQAERKLKRENHSTINVLMPGMVLLKRWLSENDQVKIVQICRDLGLGNGGFYQPGYGADNKMHLWMMCLGMHWEPLTNSYEHKRSVDNSIPPPIPSLFQELVAQCMRDANRVSQNDGSHASRLPNMHPNICLINFYERSGRLGLHQDKDESKDSLAKALPVVSFSIGDSADFVYSFNRNMDSAEHLTLESGDVLILGGPCRMIYHGVSSIIAQTAPRSLIERTNLRPGRINLTFRQT